MDMTEIYFETAKYASFSQFVFILRMFQQIVGCSTNFGSRSKNRFLGLKSKDKSFNFAAPSVIFLLFEQSKIKKANTARHVQEIIIKNRVEGFFTTVCKEAYEQMRTHSEKKVEIQIILYDFDGCALGRYP